MQKMLFLLMLVTSFAGCKKFLEKKPSSNMIIPGTLKEMQELLDNEDVMNETSSIPELAADNFYLTYNFWQSVNERERYAYIWNDALFTLEMAPDWYVPYRQVNISNVVLEGLEKLTTNPDVATWKQLKGSAHFYRAFAYYQLAQVFCKMYDSATARTDMGVPIRHTSSVTEVAGRGTVYDTYLQILDDATTACHYLPATLPLNNRNRPSLAAAWALRARTHLLMGNYELAQKCSDTALYYHAALLDYKNLNANIPLSFSRTDIEIIYQSKMQPSSQVLLAWAVPDCIIDSVLYASYDSKDMRKSLYFTINREGKPILKSTYSGFTFAFSGFAADELYLIRAECNARLDNINAAMQDLNTLLLNRWKDNYKPLTAGTSAEALAIILRERRKELVFRGLRWPDIRRLNRDGYNITLTRKLNNQVITLPPNDPHSVFIIPPEVITLGKLPQNPR